MTEWLLNISSIVLSVALLVAFTRLVIGPSLADRVVSLDLIAVISSAMVVVYAMSVNLDVYLDVAITLALIAFLSTVAFARYLEGKGGRKGPM